MDLMRYAIQPALDLLGPRYDSPEARVLLLAIAYQESNGQHRKQIRGPARGFWQFEAGGGVRGVIHHPSSMAACRDACHALRYHLNVPDCYEAITHNDVLAAVFARLLLWTDHRSLPAITDVSGAWDYYLRNWRPGKPHPDRWAACHARAIKIVTGVAP